MQFNEHQTNSLVYLHCVSEKCHYLVLLYNFDTRETILIIFGNKIWTEVKKTGLNVVQCHT